MSEEVWVFTEQKEGKLLGLSLEVLSEGRRLADQLQKDLGAVLLGYQVETLIGILGEYGAEKVYIAESERLTQYDPDAYTAILAGLVQEYNPSILLLGSTFLGEDLAPRVAARVRTGLASNCDKLQISEEGILLQTRLCFNNRIHATFVCPKARPQMATVQSGVMEILHPDESRKPTVVRIGLDAYFDFGKARTRVTGFIKADPKTVELEDAERIVAGGKGVGDMEGFQLIWDLAEVLGASVGGSRMAVDSGWISRERQIGQSGKIVSPELLVSCGISGASAHTLGIRDSKTIIAINKDRNAPIFRIADLGVVEDLHKVLPILIDLLRGNASRKGEGLS